MTEEDEPDRCEECRKAFKAGDYVTFTNRVGAQDRGPYRYWHKKCFEASLTPLPDWPMLGLAIVDERKPR